MTDLIVTALAVLWAWELLLALSPVQVPAWLQPVLVAGCATASVCLPPWALTAAAVSGAVAVLHRILVPPAPDRVLVRRRPGRTPRL